MTKSGKDADKNRKKAQGEDDDAKLRPPPSETDPLVKIETDSVHVERGRTVSYMFDKNIAKVPRSKLPSHLRPQEGEVVYDISVSSSDGSSARRQFREGLNTAGERYFTPVNAKEGNSNLPSLASMDKRQMTQPATRQTPRARTTPGPGLRSAKLPSQPGPRTPKSPSRPGLRSPKSPTRSGFSKPKSPSWSPQSSTPQSDRSGSTANTPSSLSKQSSSPKTLSWSPQSPITQSASSGSTATTLSSLSKKSRTPSIEELCTVCPVMSPGTVHCVRHCTRGEEHKRHSIPRTSSPENARAQTSGKEQRTAKSASPIPREPLPHEFAQAAPLPVSQSRTVKDGGMSESRSSVQTPAPETGSSNCEACPFRGNSKGCCVSSERPVDSPNERTQQESNTLPSEDDEASQGMSSNAGVSSTVRSPDGCASNRSTTDQRTSASFASGAQTVSCHGGSQKKLLLLDFASKFFTSDTASGPSLVDYYSEGDVVLLEFESTPKDDELVSFVTEAISEHKDSLESLEINLPLQSGPTIIKILETFQQSCKFGLKSLSIQSPGRIDFVLRFLAKTKYAKDLKRLLLHKAPVYFECSLEAFLMGCTNLEVLDTSNNDMVVGRSFGLLPSTIKALSLRACSSLTEKTLTYIERGQGQRLLSLKLGGYDSILTETEVNRFKLSHKSPKNFNRYLIRFDVIPFVSKLHDLQELSLVNTLPPTDANLLRLMSRCPFLRSFELDDCTLLSDKSMANVDRWSALARINLSFSKAISRATVNSLAKLDTLEEIILRDFLAIDDRDISKMLVSCHRLRHGFFSYHQPEDTAEITSENTIVDLILVPSDNVTVTLERYEDHVTIEIQN